MSTFWRLLGFLRPYRGGVIVSFALAAAAMGTGVLIPYLVGRTVDEIRRGGTNLWPLALAVVAAALLRLAFSVVRRLVAGRVSLGVEYDLRNRIYGHLHSLELAFFDTHQTGQLMSRVTVDLQSVRFFLGYGLIFFTQNLITIAIVAIALVWIDWQLALIAFAIAPVLSVAAFRYSRASHPVLKEVQQRVADVTTQAEENIVGVRVVKAFAQEPRQLATFSAGTERIFDQALLAARLQAKYVPFMSSLPNLAMAAVVLAGGYRVVHGDLSLGAFFAVNGYLLLLVVPLRSIGMWVGQYQRAMASGERIFEVLDYDRDILDRPDAQALAPGPGAIHMAGVRFGYDPDSPVL